MNVLQRNFGLLPSGNRHCIRTKLIKCMACVAILLVTLVATVELHRTTAFAESMERYNDAIRADYGRNVQARIQAEEDREIVIQDANKSCRGGR